MYDSASARLSTPSLSRATLNSTLGSWCTEKDAPARSPPTLRPHLRGRETLCERRPSLRRCAGHPPAPWTCRLRPARTHFTCVNSTPAVGARSAPPEIPRSEYGTGPSKLPPGYSLTVRVFTVRYRLACCPRRRWSRCSLHQTARTTKGKLGVTEGLFSEAHRA